MSKKLALIVAAFILFTIPLALAQMRGGGGGNMGQGSGMGGGRMGSSGMGGKQTDWPGMDSSQMQQRRRQLRTTDVQDQKYRRCNQSVKRVRNRLHQMSDLTRSRSVDVAQLGQLHDQLSNDIDDLEQQLDDLAASLNEDQKNADGEKLQDLMKSTKDLDAFSEQLGYELDQENADTAKVQKKIRQTDAAAKQVQKQERDLAESLGIEP